MAFLLPTVVGTKLSLGCTGVHRNGVVASAPSLGYSMLMLIVLALLVATAGFAQTSKDASTLVREVSESALMTKSWIIEGSIKYSALPENATFRLEIRSPKESRFDQTGGETPSTIICDGSNAWVISRPLGVYTKALVADYPNCAPIV